MERSAIRPARVVTLDTPGFAALHPGYRPQMTEREASGTNQVG